MNRADRRRLQKYGDINGQQATLRLDDYIHLYTLSFILALDSCELPKEKVTEVMEKLYETIECMISGHINKDDVENMAHEVYGIDFAQSVKQRLYVKDAEIVKV